VTVTLFLQLCQILAALGGAGNAIIAIRKDIDERMAAGTLKPEDPFPAEHMDAVQHRVEAGRWASDAVWDANHANSGG
jgi:hypothetical protein